MATEVKLIINTEQAKAALNGINEQVTQLRVNGATVTLGGKKVKAQLDKAKQGAEGVGKAQQETGKKGVKAVLQMLRSWKTFTTQMGAAKQSVTAFASAFVSKVTIIILAVQMATKTFTYFFEKLTQSIPKLVAKMQNMVKIAQKNEQQFKKEKQVSDDYIKTLKQLSQKQQLSNTQQLLAQAIIDKLSKKYKGLSISIDETTGAIIGLSEALPLIQDQDREQQIKLLREQISAQKSLVNAKFAETFGSSNIKLGKPVKGRDFFSFAENVFGTQFTPFAQNLAKSFNTGKLDNIIKTIQNVSQSTYDQEVATKISGLLDALYKLKELNTSLGDYFDPLKTVIKNTGDILDDIAQLQGKVDELQGKTQNVAQKTQQNAAKHAYDELKTPQQRADALQKQIDDLNSQLDKTSKDIDASKKKEFDSYAEDKTLGTESISYARALDQRRAEARELNDIVKRRAAAYKELLELNGNLSQQNLRNLGRTWEEELKLLQEKQKTLRDVSKGPHQIWSEETLNQAIQRIKRIIEADQAKLSLGPLLKQIQQLEQKFQEIQKARTAAAKAGAQSAVETAQLELQSAELKQKIQQKTFQLQKQQQQIEEQRLQQERAIESVYASYETQLDNLHKSTRQIAVQTALANAEKAKGAELTEEQIQKITQYVQLLEHMKQIEEEQARIQREQEGIDNVFKDYQENQSVEYLKIIGAQKEAVLLQARLNAEKAKGAKLTEEELESLKNYVDVQQMINEANQPLEINAPQSQVITNELAKKGGFASSVVVDRAQDINKQILGQTKKQTDLVGKIRDEIAKYSVIQ